MYRRFSFLAMRRLGFTLGELLIVVGIIALLIGLLVPAVMAVRRDAVAVQCESNLRQWSGAVNQYAVESRGYLPRRGQGQQPVLQISRPDDWFNALPPLMKMQGYYDLALADARPTAGDGSLWMCPAATRAAGIVNYFSYAMNMALSTRNMPQPDRIDKAGQSATMVFMVDAPGAYCAALPRSQPYSPVARHRGRVNVSFLDGHVAAFDGSYIGCNTGDPAHADVRWLVPGSTWQAPP